MSLRARLAMDQTAEGSQNMSRKRRVPPSVSSSSNRDTPEGTKPSKRQKLSGPSQADQARADVQNAFEDDLNCPICLELMVGCQIINPCGHMACGICSDQWITQRPNPTCHTCREPASPLKALIPCRSFDSVIEKHIMVLEANGSVDWLKEGQKRKDWDRRIGEWTDIKNRPQPGVDRRHGLRRAVVEQADDHAALLRHMFALDENDDEDDEGPLDPDVLEALSRAANESASSDGESDEGIEFLGAREAHRPRRNQPPQPPPVPVEESDSENSDESEEEAEPAAVPILPPQGVHWEDGGEEWREGEPEDDGEYEDAPDFHDGLYDLDADDYPDFPYYLEDMGDEDALYDDDVPYDDDRDSSPPPDEEDYLAELWDEDAPESDGEDDFDVPYLDEAEADDEAVALHEARMAHALRNYRHAAHDVQGDGIPRDRPATERAARSVDRETREVRREPGQIIARDPGTPVVPRTPAAPRPHRAIAPLPARASILPRAELVNGRPASPPPRPSTSVNRRRAPPAQRNAPGQSDDEDRGQTIIRASLAEQLERLRRDQDRGNNAAQVNLAAHAGPVRTHRRFNSPPAASVHRRFVSPQVVLPATPPHARRPIPLTPPSPDIRPAPQTARRSALSTPRGARATQARRTPTPAASRSRNHQERHPEERQHSRSQVTPRPASRQDRQDGARRGNANGSRQQRSETIQVVRVLNNPAARRARR